MMLCKYIKLCSLLRHLIKLSAILLLLRVYSFFLLAEHCQYFPERTPKGVISELVRSWYGVVYQTCYIFVKFSLSYSVSCRPLGRYNRLGNDAQTGGRVSVRPGARGCWRSPFTAGDSSRRASGLGLGSSSFFNPADCLLRHRRIRLINKCKVATLKRVGGQVGGRAVSLGVGRRLRRVKVERGGEPACG